MNAEDYLAGAGCVCFGCAIGRWQKVGRRGGIPAFLLSLNRFEKSESRTFILHGRTKLFAFDSTNEEEAQPHCVGAQRLLWDGASLCRPLDRLCTDVH